MYFTNLLLCSLQIVPRYPGWNRLGRHLGTGPIFQYFYTWKRKEVARNGAAAKEIPLICIHFGWLPSGQTHDLKEPFELLHLCSTAVTQYFIIVLAVIRVPSLQKRSFFLGQSGRPPFLHPYDLFMFTFLLPLHLHWNKLKLPKCYTCNPTTRVMINSAHLLGSAGINLDNVDWRFCLCFAVLTKASSETIKREDTHDIGSAQSYSLW